MRPVLLIVWLLCAAAACRSTPEETGASAARGSEPERRAVARADAPPEPANDAGGDSGAAMGMAMGTGHGAAPSSPAASAPPRAAGKTPPPLDAQPACVPMPVAPSTQRPRPGDAPTPTEIARNASAGARLPEVGDRAAFGFDSEAGEQSLFEIAGFGYSRAAKGKVLLSITDDAGQVLWQTERQVGTQWRDFAAFLAPRAGRFTYAVTAVEEAWRFVVVRHSDFAPLGAEPLDLEGRARVHGFLPSGDAVARYRVPVRAGEELALKLAGTREEAREEARRGAVDAAAMAAGMKPSAGMRGEAAKTARGAPAPLFQTFELEVRQGDAVLASVGPYARVRVPADGVLEVRVRARRPIAAGTEGGGLFDLEVRRDLAPFEIEGVVVDSEDRPLGNVELLFLLEPDADPVYRTRTDAKGHYRASVFAGDLAVQLAGDRRAGQSAIHVHVDAARTLDLVFVPGARIAGK